MTLKRYTVRCAVAIAATLVLLSAGAEPVPRTSGFVEVPGGPVWYEIMGDGDGVPLLTLHGGPGGTSCGLQALAPLGRERPVVRYDQLGSGRSGRPDDLTLWQRDRFVDALHRLRQELGLVRLHLHGHSWGGALAAYYVLEKGSEGIVSLTLSSPLLSTADWIADADILRKSLPADVQRTLREHEAAGSTDSAEYAEATERFYELFLTRGDAVESHACVDAPWNPVVYEYMWGPTEFHATGTLRDFDVTQRLDRIDVPTLFVTGEFDEARPVTVERYARSVPGARFEVIPGVGHASISRAPDRYRDMLAAFMSAAEAESRP